MTNDKGKVKPVDVLRCLHRKPFFAAAGVCIVGLLFTLLVSYWLLGQADRSDIQRFDRLGERIEAEIARRLLVYDYGLRGARGVFAASQRVDRHEFIAMVESRRLQEEFPGSLGMGYIRRVKDDADAFQAYLDEVRADDAPDFAITIPPGSRLLRNSRVPGRFIIEYIEPLDRNLSACGLDIGAHPVRREAAERAVIADDACLTGIIGLVQDDARIPGFLLLLPVYQSGMPTDTEQQRIDALTGWAYMPLLAPEIMADIEAVADNELQLTIYDTQRHDKDTLIYSTRPPENIKHVAPAKTTIGDDRRIERQLHIVAGGRPWTINLESSGQFSHASLDVLYLVASGGSLLSILLAIIIYTQASATFRAQKLAEGMTKDLRSMADAAQQATLVKSAFLANMSHEIRTPMTAILGYTELIEQNLPDNARQSREHLATIKRNGDHLLELINDILDISKVEAGKMQVEQKKINLRQMLADVRSLMLVKADEKKLPLNIWLETPCPTTIQTDPLRLKQILVNILGNAIKFTEQGKVDVCVTYRPGLDRNELTITVTDTGVGMTKQQRDLLFQPFQQVDASTTRKHGGTGLGLNISHKLTHMLGGDITVDSQPGKGSRFTITIDPGPMTEVTLAPAGPITSETLTRDDAPANPLRESTQANTEAKPAPDQPLKGCHILLAEDGPDNQKLIAFILHKAGAEIVIKDNGQLALEALTVDGKPDGLLKNPCEFHLLLSDMQMPVMDGYTLARTLREKGSSLPIIALTAHAMSSDAQKCLAAGCTAYATKPINRPGLIALCEAAFESAPQRLAG